MDKIGLNHRCTWFITNSNTWYYMEILQYGAGTRFNCSIKTDGTLWDGEIIVTGQLGLQ